ncbi:MAG: IclR family transcriptional regulator [Burkholderiales bacterium]|nr:IclR family transcriptional regulator [Burkholderiales bacterium]
MRTNGKPRQPGTSRAPAENAKNRIQTFAKMMRVLRSFSRVDRHLPLAAIAENAQLPRATAHRILSALREIGFIEQDIRRGTYCLGLGLFELGSLARANMDLMREAKPLVDELARASATAAHLGVFNGMEIVVVEREDQPGHVMRGARLFETAPAYCTGLGKAVLAHQPQEVLDRIVAAGLKRYTRNTLTTVLALQRDLARVRQRGYATDKGEHQLWTHCVAAPIRDASGRVFSAVSVTGPIEQVSAERTPVLAELVVQTAASISRQLGHEADDDSTDARASSQVGSTQRPRRSAYAPK